MMQEAFRLIASRGESTYLRLSTRSIRKLNARTTAGVKARSTVLLVARA